MFRALILLVVGCLLVIGVVAQCFAHSGRTDSSGGHRVTKTGGYHYHNGGFSRPARTSTYRPRSYQPTYRSTSRTSSSRARTTARTSSKVRKPREKVRWEVREVDFKFSEVMDDGECKVMLYVHKVLDRSTLVAVAKKVNQKRVKFYLPGMSGNDEPWAVSSYIRSTNNYSCSVSMVNLKSQETFKIVGKVKRVTSGSDIVIEFDKLEFRVRLYGLTVPAIREDHFRASQAKLEAMCIGEEVIAYCKDKSEDRRLLSMVKLDDAFLNNKMLLIGYAAVADDVEGELLRTKLNRDEALAKSKNAGLWAKGWKPVVVD